MMGTSGSPSAVAGFLEGMAAMAKLLADPEALEKLRAEFAAYGDIADKKLAAAAAANAEASAKQKDAVAKASDNDARAAALEEREKTLEEACRSHDVSVAAFDKDVAARMAAIAAREADLDAQHAVVTEKATSIDKQIADAFRTREIELNGRATAVAERENRMSRQESDYAVRLSSLEAREQKAKSILDRAAALSEMV